MIESGLSPSLNLMLDVFTQFLCKTLRIAMGVLGAKGPTERPDF
jgi:hypothetical protein